MQILVTGATGMVGKSLVAMLKKNGFFVRTTSREINKHISRANSSLNGGVYFDLDAIDNDYDKLLDGIDVVVHLAARVHVSSRKNKKNNEVCKRTNTIGTEILLKESIRRGVKRFIYLSTVKVNGEVNSVNENGESMSFREIDNPCPKGAYAISKLEAEDIIYENCCESKTEFVILRPPLIYGPGVKANFLLLLKIVDKSIPLPLKTVTSKRSLLYVDNLSSAISVCLKHPNVANKVYLVSDIDISVPDLVSKIASLLKRRILVFPFPIGLLKGVVVSIGKRSIIDRVVNPLRVDGNLFSKDTDWVPPYSFDEGLGKTVDWYLSEKIFSEQNIKLT